MTAIDRTAYPRPGSRLTRKKLRARYTVTEAELHARIYSRALLARVTAEHLAIQDALLVKPSNARRPVSTA
jgi:hypothetical protein